MANRTFNQTQLLILSKRIVSLYPVVSVGAAGAVTLKKRQFTAMGASSAAASSSLVNAPTTGTTYVVGDAVGTRSVARTGAGAWTITLSDSYQYLLGVEVIQVSNSSGAVTSGYQVGVVSGSTNVTTNTATGNGGVIAIILNNGSGSGTDPASGDTVTLCITLGDATEP